MTGSTILDVLMALSFFLSHFLELFVIAMICTRKQELASALGVSRMTVTQATRARRSWPPRRRGPWSSPQWPSRRAPTAVIAPPPGERSVVQHAELIAALRAGDRTAARRAGGARRRGHRAGAAAHAQDGPGVTRVLDIGVLPSGPLDAITDVAGIRVGSVTLIDGEGPLRRGLGPVRTGVTVVVPETLPLFAGCHRLNGNGELTGLEWIRESGCLTTAIALTNTHSVGVVRDALIAAEVARRGDRELFWSLPVVGETWDGVLNDINGFHVRAEHVHEALVRASSGPVEQGGVGSGTGMICHGFKGGIGTASRVVSEAHGGWTVGVLVQANHGVRERLAVDGLPVGRVLGPDVVPEPDENAAGAGSIIVLCATDAPLLPHQCTRLAQRCALGVARTGGAGEHSSGDLMLAFSTAAQGIPASEVASKDEPATIPVTMVVDSHITPLFHAAVEATEAAIVNALLAAETMVGRDGITAHALTAERLLDAIERVKGV